MVINVPDDAGGSLGLAQDNIMVAVGTAQEAPTKQPLESGPDNSVVAAPHAEEASGDLRDWIIGLPDSTIIAYEKGSKAPGSKSGARYAAYSGSRTMGEYRRVQEKRFLWQDFKYDLAHGFVSLPRECWDTRRQVTSPVVSALSASPQHFDPFVSVFQGTNENIGDRLWTIGDVTGMGTASRRKSVFVGRRYRAITHRWHRGRPPRQCDARSTRRKGAASRAA